MRGTTRWLVIAVLVMGLSVGAVAQTTGIGAAAFLRRGVDARALAMGGAHVAVADGYGAMYWNPAGLARTESPQIGGMTAELYGAEIYLNFLAGVYPWVFREPQLEPTEIQTPSAIAFRPPAQRMGVGIAFTEMATELRAYDAQGNPLGLIRYSEALYGLGVATWVPGLGYVGGGVKSYSFRAPQAGVDGADATASGLGFDTGLALPLVEGLWLGIAGADIGHSRIAWRNTPLEPTDKVSARYTVGGSFQADTVFSEGDRLLAALDLTLEPLLATRALRGGLEYTLAFMSLRAGAVMRQEVPLSFTAGVGVHVMQLAIDTAWVQNRELEAEGAGHTLVISAGFRF